ncbi:AMP-binding enzyme [Ruminiclostridium cellobioparum]|uniref:AMP-binding enzyme n=1 Tax=Ruminiclostridium cellobioparum TaxID=29355 RepID=UPI000AE45CDB|nr:hypothetical protein [Ruminiclostridium cellobioparum]
MLLKNPVVKEAAVIGGDDERLGQKIVALVVLKEQCQAEVKDIYKWCVARSLKTGRFQRKYTLFPGYREM